MDSEFMDEETYEQLCAVLANANPEDFINLVTVALMDREDTKYSMSPSGTTGEFIVPSLDTDNLPDRLFTIVITSQKLSRE